jgi:hypothetical protein
MPKFTNYVDPSENKVHSDLSIQNLMAHTRTISRWSRESGSEGEKRAFDYIEKELRSLRLSVRRDEFDSFVSFPEAGWLEIISPESKKIEGLPPSFSASTSEEGFKGELVYMGLGGESDYAGKIVSGKILLIDGLPSPEAARRAEDRGAKGLVAAGDDHLHYMIITTIWGGPTLSKKYLIPKIPCLCILRRDGDLLKERLRGYPLVMRIVTKVQTGFKKIPVLTGHLKGKVEKERFLLLSGHVDSWDFGAQDNAGANAAMLEMARVLQKKRSGMRRGVTFAFWSGHSQGRYSGSTWYADRFWEDLYRNGIAHLNVDCIGAKGATDYSNLFGTEDTWDLGEKLIFDCTGQRVKARHSPRAGDQSFWGIGLPSLFMDLSGIPAGKDLGESTATASFIGTSGLPWWWHTKEDTFDKIDPGILHLDTKIYLSSVLRLCNSPVLPLNEETMGREILKTLEAYDRMSKGLLNLSKSIRSGKIFLQWAKRLNRTIDQYITSKGKPLKWDQVNSCLMEVSRKLIPLNYTAGEPFDHDLAIPMPSIPTLAAFSKLPQLNPRVDDFKFLETELIRKQNQVCHLLHQASEAIQESIPVTGERRW